MVKSLLVQLLGSLPAVTDAYHAGWSDFKKSCDKSLPYGLHRFWGSQPHPDKSMSNILHDPNDPQIAILPKWDTNGKQTIPLADTHVAVRFLGGVSPYANATHANCTDGTGKDGVWCDLVTRVPGTDTADGKFVSRWDLVNSRLDKFAENDVDLMIVLDNVPWAFVNVTKSTCESYGCQYLPPDYPSQFAWWVGELAKHLEASYGSPYANRIRWRLGTEANGPRWSDRGKYFQQYLKSYQLTMKRIKAVLPSAQVGASNWVEIVGNSGDFSPSGSDSFQYKFYEAVGADASIPLDFISQSWYGGGSSRHGVNFPGSDYVQRTPSGTSGQNEMAAMRQLANRPAATLEVQEWGILKNEAGQSTNEPSSVGAAWAAGSATTWLCNGAHRVFHWETTVSIRNSTGDKRLVKFYEQWSWNMAVLELFLGGKPRFTVYDKVNPSAGVGHRGSVAKIESVKSDASYILLAGVGANRSDNFYTFVPVTIESPGGGDVSIEQYEMTSETSIVEMVIRELKGKSGMFLHPNKPLPGRTFSSLLTADGMAYVEQNLDRYWAQNIENLKPKAYPREWSVADGIVTLHPQVQAYSVTVIVIKPASLSV